MKTGEEKLIEKSGLISYLKQTGIQPQGRVQNPPYQPA
jgi:hypothetical protein